MFYVEPEKKPEKTTRTFTKQHMCSVIQLNSSLHILNAKSRNALTASDTVIQKAFAIEKQDASSVQDIIQPSTIHEKLNLKTSNACCVKEITQSIIKAARSTKMYKKDISPHYRKRK